ncbi:hypothetical protein BDP55DRAFT_683047 [Colletotrichum godetiae]|uniref:Uncharacterized protein n=1 Tax=Colletotrichum godetiae TaxID=1209918 RepID=A0AAJ0A889_9PEZI|nr:uncharacterized protein BDP55DRAFT_683047 [Colletotrichum godetiae]KAK1658333.1 hypothetical protein BDP55DRAFT_683047 [Colletotrichum godetiae]
MLCQLEDVVVCDSIFCNQMSWSVISWIDIPCQAPLGILLPTRLAAGFGFWKPGAGAPGIRETPNPVGPAMWAFWAFWVGMPGAWNTIRC